MQCPSCGVARQGPVAELADKTEFYRHRYGLYHKRVGTASSELERYDGMAAWILAELGDFEAGSIVDIGCGGGFLLGAVKKARPSIECAGVDPSLENSESARARGFIVVTGTVPGAESSFKRTFDLAVAANVISHITDPHGFLKALSEVIVPSGRVVIYGHNGDIASADLLWADIEFSFCREHLIEIAAKAGLQHVNPNPIPPPPGQEDKYVLVFRRSETPWSAGLDKEKRESLLAERRLYFASWQLVAQRLSGLESSRNVFNFGASFWSMALAAYCPQYWGRVQACVVDGGDGSFFGKPIIKTDSISPDDQRPLIVLGTNPASQSMLARRLSAVGDVIRWDDLITR
jgi:SAM-dependent methyltransferase